MICVITLVVALIATAFAVTPSAVTPPTLAKQFTANFTFLAPNVSNRFSDTTNIGCSNHFVAHTYVD
jgi:hypothetical protein